MTVQFSWTSIQFLESYGLNILTQKYVSEESEQI